MAVRNASDFYQRKKVSKAHAVNSVSIKVMNLFDRAVKESWDVAKYNKNLGQCPLTTLGSILNDKILGSTNVYDKTPNFSNLKELIDGPLCERS